MPVMLCLKPRTGVNKTGPGSQDCLCILYSSQSVKKVHNNKFVASLNCVDRFTVIEFWVRWFKEPVLSACIKEMPWLDFLIRRNILVNLTNSSMNISTSYFTPKSKSKIGNYLLHNPFKQLPLKKHCGYYRIKQIYLHQY